MIKKTMLPISAPEADQCDRRVVIWRDEFPRTRKDLGDHMFVMWWRHPKYGPSDKGAECPFEPELDKNGEETDQLQLKDGLFVFSVNLYDHSGLSFSLDGDPAGGADPGGFDTTVGAAFLYIDKPRFEAFQGKERWMKVPTDPDDWSKPWRDAKDRLEFRQLTLRPCAQGEVDDINMLEDGSTYGYDIQVKTKWTKTYADGTVEEGFDWDTDPDEHSCGGFLTRHADDIDFPREPDLPVFYDDDVCLYMDKKRGLGSYEYVIPEFVIRQDTGRHIGNKVFYDYFAGMDERTGEPYWVMEPEKAKRYHSWFKVTNIAREIITNEDFSPYGNCVRLEECK